MSRIERRQSPPLRAATAPPRGTVAAPAAWTFFSNHAHVLFCLAANPGMLLRDVAAHVGITERAVQRIVADLEAAGVLARVRKGRRNRYKVDPRVSLRHPVEAHRNIGDLLALVLADCSVDS
jgi:DNA-binding IclR family transcriptional regulator